MSSKVKRKPRRQRNDQHAQQMFFSHLARLVQRLHSEPRFSDLIFSGKVVYLETEALPTSQVGFCEMQAKRFAIGTGADDPACRKWLLTENEGVGRVFYLSAAGGGGTLCLDVDLSALAEFASDPESFTREWPRLVRVAPGTTDAERAERLRAARLQTSSRT